LEEREVEMSVESICLETGKPVEDFDRSLSNQRQIDERLSNPDVGSVVGADLHSEEAAKLLVVFDKGVLKIGPKGMVGLIETFHNHLELAFEPLGDPGAEHVGYLVGS
jgi:hypothetical protein